MNIITNAMRVTLIKYLFACLMLSPALVGARVAAPDSSEEKLIAPQLLTPADETVYESVFQQPMFSWMPSGAGSSARYALIIKEKLPYQSRAAALQANPVFFSRANLTVSFLAYPITAPSFQPGKTYVWQVLVEEPESGAREYSEAWIFSFKPQAPLKKSDAPAAMGGGEEEDPPEEFGDFVYAVPNLAPGAGLYNAAGDTLPVSYHCAYAPATGERLSYSVYSEGSLAPFIVPSVAPQEVVYGRNRFHLDVSALSAGYYLLKIFNQREEVYYVRFYKQ